MCNDDKATLLVEEQSLFRPSHWGPINLGDFSAQLPPWRAVSSLVVVTTLAHR
jgi:hypothetical protein